MGAVKRGQRRTWGIAALIAATATTLPMAIGWAQSGTGAMETMEMTMAGALSGKALPLSLPMKDLTGGDWRRVTLREGGLPRSVEDTPFVLLYRYYTQGRTVRISGETFLVAYRQKQPEVRDGDKAAEVLLRGADKPLPDAVLSLALLNIRTIGALDDVQIVDLSRDLVNQADLDRAKAAAIKTVSLSNLKQLGTGLLMYSQDYDEVFPPMKTAAGVKKLLSPYIKDDSVFINPITQKPYLPNP
jgi:hypothetical protein